MAITLLMNSMSKFEDILIELRKTNSKVHRVHTSPALFSKILKRVEEINELYDNFIPLDTSPKYFIIQYPLLGRIRFVKDIRTHDFTII